MRTKLHYLKWSDSNTGFDTTTLCNRDYMDVDYTVNPESVSCSFCKRRLPKALEHEKSVQWKYDNAVTIHPETGEELPYGYTWVRNLLCGGYVKEHVMTPHFCSVGSETYWSM